MPTVEKHTGHRHESLHSPIAHLTDFTHESNDADQYAPANLYLGCKHEANTMLLGNGVAAREDVYEMKD